MTSRPNSASTDRFELSDVGITHPNNDAFIRIDRAGRIHIMSQPNLGIIIDPATQTVAFVGDKVKVVTKEDEGFKWNNLSFNPRSVNYAEPTFTIAKEAINHIYDDVDRFL